jgi:hypothetical protein
MNFANVKSITIPEGKVKRIISGETVLWQEPASYANLVPTAIGKDGEILDGIGFRKGATWDGNGNIATASAFTAIGLIPIDGSVTHEIYVYGINFSGTANNRMPLYKANYASLAITNNLKEGTSGSYIASITKLADNYFKITTKTYSTNVKYFALSGVTVSGLDPIVTMDEEIPV